MKTEQEQVDGEQIINQLKSIDERLGEENGRDE